MAPRKCWKRKVGGHGHTVIVGERTPGGVLYLWLPRKGSGGYDKQSLGHRDKELALARAKQVSGQILAARRAMKEGRRPLPVLFAKYEADVSKGKKGQQPKEDRRRIELWTVFFQMITAQRRPKPGQESRKAEGFDARKITVNHLRRFIRMRREGRIQLPPIVLKNGKVRERKLTPKPSLTTIGADIVFLQSVLNWAVDERLLKRNPIRGFQAPKTKNPKQPVATFDRFVRVLRAANHVDPQGLFRDFFLLIGNEIDWRVSALCQLRLSDIDLTIREDAPWGRIRKDEDVDKEGEGGWVPLTPRGRRACVRILRKRRAIGSVYAFPSPKRPGKPWSRWHARDLLERAEKRAGLEAMDGGDFHPYRRKWSSERRHHPWADIAAVSGRKDRRTFERSYAKADAAGVLAVAVNDPRKLAELGHKLGHAGQKGNRPAALKSDRAVG